MSDKQGYQRVPKEFLEDIYVVPKLFINPENEEHGDFVNDQMRYELFHDTMEKIGDIELSKLKSDEDFIKLKQIKSCERQRVWGQVLQFFKANKEDELIRCEDWTITINNQAEVVYQVKHFQSPLDRFYSVLIPPGLYRNYIYLKENML